MDKARLTGEQRQNLLLIAIIILAILVRFYDFSNRITFGPEQAISLIVSGDYLKEKITLLGDPNIQRFTKDGLMLFHSPNFNYLMVPVMFILNYQVVEITGYFALLNVITGILIFIVGRKYFDYFTGLFASILFLFNSHMIYHSMFIWIQNYIPLMSILIIYLLLGIRSKTGLNPVISILLIGFMTSLCLGAQYFFIFTIPLIYVAVLLSVRRSANSGKELIASLMFILGFVFGYLPTILFNIKHNYYDVVVLWQYAVDTLNNPGQNRISYYHFLQFWPLFALTAGWSLSKIYSKFKIAAIIILSSVVLFNLLSDRVNFSAPTGMHPGLNFPKLKQVASIIAGDKPSDFNLVTTHDFDSRAHPLRYLLKFNHNYIPKGLEDYPQATSLYVLTSKDYPLQSTTLWEISSFKFNQVTPLGKIDNFIILKLTKK